MRKLRWQFSTRQKAAETPGFLWVGPIQGEDVARENKAVSFAATKWQSSMLSACLELDESGSLVSYCPQRVFPRGPFFSEEQEDPDGFKRLSISFVNIPFFRKIHLSVRILYCYLAKLGAPRTIVTYNSPFEHLLTGIVARCLGNRWVNIVADGQYNFFASLNVFLSHAYYVEARVPSDRKLYFPGGSFFGQSSTRDLRCASKPQGGKVVLYSGSWTQWTGVSQLVTDFLDYDAGRKVDVKLILVGCRPSKEFEEVVFSHPRIVVMGFVPSEELHGLHHTADVLLNPRPIEIAKGHRNFPSKLLDFLSISTPVLSTRSPSLGALFDDVFTFYTPGLDFAGQLALALEATETDREKILAARLKLAATLDWGIAAEKVLGL